MRYSGDSYNLIRYSVRALLGFILIAGGSSSLAESLDPAPSPLYENSLRTSIARFNSQAGAAAPHERGQAEMRQETPPIRIASPTIRGVFIRGDADCDGAVTPADTTFLKNAVLGIGPDLVCRRAGDVNHDCRVDLLDVEYLIAFLNGTGDPPPHPYPDCGIDTICTDDLIPCDEHCCDAPTLPGTPTCAGASTCPGQYTCIGGATCAAIETCQPVTCTTEPTCAGSSSTCAGNETCDLYPSCPGTPTCNGETCIGSATCRGSETCFPLLTCPSPPTYDPTPQCANVTMIGFPSCAGSSTCPGTFTCLGATCAAMETCVAHTCNAQPTCEGSGGTCAANITCAGYVSCAGTATCGTDLATCIGSSTCQGSETCYGVATCWGDNCGPTYSDDCLPTIDYGCGVSVFGCSSADEPAARLQSPTMSGGISCAPNGHCPTSAAAPSCPGGLCPTLQGAVTCSPATCVTTPGSPSCEGGSSCPTQPAWSTCPGGDICVTPTLENTPSCAVQCPTLPGTETCAAPTCRETCSFCDDATIRGGATCSDTPTCAGGYTCIDFATCGSQTCWAQATCSAFGSTCAGIATCPPAATCGGETCADVATCPGFSTCGGSITCDHANTCTGNPSCAGTTTCGPGYATCSGNPTCNMQSTCGGWPTCVLASCAGMATCTGETCADAETCSFSPTCHGYETCPVGACGPTIGCEPTVGPYATCDDNTTCNFTPECGATIGCPVSWDVFCEPTCHGCMDCGCPPCKEAGLPTWDGTATCDETPTCYVSTTCTLWPTCAATCTAYPTCYQTCSLCDDVTIDQRCNGRPTSAPSATCDFQPTCRQSYTCNGFSTCGGTQICLPTCTPICTPTLGGLTCGETCTFGLVCSPTCTPGCSYGPCDESYYPTFGCEATCDGVPTCALSPTCGSWPNCQAPPYGVPRLVRRMFDELAINTSHPPSPCFTFEMWHEPLSRLLRYGDFTLTTPDPGLPVPGLFFEVAPAVIADISTGGAWDTVLVEHVYPGTRVEKYIDSDRDYYISAGDYLLIRYVAPEEIDGQTAWYVVRSAGQSDRPPIAEIGPVYIVELLAQVPPPPPLLFAVDILPGICPNVVDFGAGPQIIPGPNRDRRDGADFSLTPDLAAAGANWLPVAILGGPLLDVDDLDPMSFHLAGVAPGKSPQYGDVSSPAPVKESPCECDGMAPDGYTDLILWYETAQVTANLESTESDAPLMVSVAGTTKNGKPLQASDCLWSHDLNVLPASADRHALPEFALTHYPNPFNAATTITYSLSEDGPVRLEVFNILGQRVTSLLDEHQSAGQHTIEWNATDGSGRRIASGMYFFRLTVGAHVISRKMIVLK